MLTAWKLVCDPSPFEESMSRTISSMHGLGVGPVPVVVVPIDGVTVLDVEGAGEVDGPVVVVVIGADTVVCAEVGVPDGVEAGEIEEDVGGAFDGVAPDDVVVAACVVGFELAFAL